MSAAAPSGDAAAEKAEIILHASAVAVQEQAVLITGRSGSGKSALALQLLAMGARLVSDDRVVLRREGDRVVATAPDTIRGLIEARGVGLLRSEPVESAEVALVVSRDDIETERLPPARTMHLLGLELPLLHNVERAHFPAAVLLYLRAGRSA